MKIVIPGEMPGFNEIIAAAQQGKRTQGKKAYQAYGSMKKYNTDLVTWVAKKVPKKKRIHLDITWIAKDKRRDPDNIAGEVIDITDRLIIIKTKHYTTSIMKVDIINREYIGEAI